jgi:phage terminase large subunit
MNKSKNYNHDQMVETLEKLGFDHECWVYLGKVKELKTDVIQQNYVNEFETIVFNINNQTSEIINIVYDNGFVQLVEKDLKYIIKESKHYNQNP